MNEMSGEVLPQALAILQRVWGYNEFRSVQAQIVQSERTPKGPRSV